MGLAAGNPERGIHGSPGCSLTGSSGIKEYLSTILYKSMFFYYSLNIVQNCF
jgi:hypothetical protein